MWPAPAAHRRALLDPHLSRARFPSWLQNVGSSTRSLQGCADGGTSATGLLRGEASVRTAMPLTSSMAQSRLVKASGASRPHRTAFREPVRHFCLAHIRECSCLLLRHPQRSPHQGAFQVSRSRAGAYCMRYSKRDRLGSLHRRYIPIDLVAGLVRT